MSEPVALTTLKSSLPTVCVCGALYHYKDSDALAHKRHCHEYGEAFEKFMLPAERAMSEWEEQAKERWGR